MPIHKHEGTINLTLSTGFSSGVIVTVCAECGVLFIPLDQLRGMTLQDAESRLKEKPSNDERYNKMDDPLRSYKSRLA